MEQPIYLLNDNNKQPIHLITDNIKRVSLYKMLYSIISRISCSFSQTKMLHLWTEISCCKRGFHDLRIYFLAKKQTNRKLNDYIFLISSRPSQDVLISFMSQTLRWKFRISWKMQNRGSQRSTVTVGCQWF
jgi:hypothetical protein